MDYSFYYCFGSKFGNLLCVEATDKLDPHKNVTPTNRELLAQGTGNIISGLVGGLPITQVIVRSSANIQSGGRTKFSAIIHGFLIIDFGYLNSKVTQYDSFICFSCYLIGSWL